MSALCSYSDNAPDMLDPLSHPQADFPGNQMLFPDAGCKAALRHHRLSRAAQIAGYLLTTVPMRGSGYLKQ
jgi:hypothetical protein